MSSTSVPSFVGLPCDVLDELFQFCDIKSVGRIALSCRCLSSFTKQPDRSHWKYRLCWLLRVPQEEVQSNVTIYDKEENFCSLLRLALEEYPSSQQRILGFDDKLWLLEDFLEHRFFSWMKGWAVSVDLIGWNLYRIRIPLRIRDDICAICHNYHGTTSHNRGISNQPTTVIRRRRNKDLEVKKSSIWYFECRLIEPTTETENDSDDHNNNSEGSEEFCVAIGVCTTNFSPWGNQPGWTREGIGYHGDDGMIYHGGNPMAYGPRYGVGDVVGFGFHIPSRSIFFTKNGKFLGTAFSLIEEDNYTVKNESLYPVVGVDTDIVDVIVNFGTNDAFEFNVTIAEEIYDQYPPFTVDQEKKKCIMKLLDDHDATGQIHFHHRLNEHDTTGQIHFHPWGDHIMSIRIPSPELAIPPDLPFEDFGQSYMDESDDSEYDDDDDDED